MPGCWTRPSSGSSTSRDSRLPPEIRGSYVELVIAGSKTELPMSRAEILEPALEELKRFFPETRAREAAQERHPEGSPRYVLRHAGFGSIGPGRRPRLPGLYLAGDWTQTEWPSQRWRARRAAGAWPQGELVGDRRKFMAPELASGGLMKWLKGTLIKYSSSQRIKLRCV
jgi:hypothetical protein